MKAKTIKAVIAKKIADWTESIEDEAVRAIAKKNTIVTGGCIASMLLKEKVNDFDIYFRTKDAAEQVALYYVRKFNTAQGTALAVLVEEGRIRITTPSKHRGATAGEADYIAEDSSAADEYKTLSDTAEVEDTYEEQQDAALEVEDTGKEKYRPVFLSTNAITLSGKVQVILRFFGEPEEIHKNYDFVHCTNYWQSWDGKLTLHQAALESLLARELRYVGSKYPICSVFRLRKFIKRNWTINAGQILKMCWQISELDLKDPKVLEDQLTGVDVAFFGELMYKLKEKDPEKVNAAYLVEIIDRMF